MHPIARYRPLLSSTTLAMALALGACGAPGTESPGGLAMTVDTLGDTISVKILSGSVWGDTGTLVPQMTIGVADGPDEYLLGRIRSMAVSAEGEVYLMDTQVPALRKYAADGTYLTTFGREGSGPGEYRRPDGGLAVLSDGRVVLRDPGNNRFAVYGSDGTYLEQWEISGTFNTGNPLVRSHDDDLYTMVLLEAGLAPWDWKYGLARYQNDGTMTDTVAMPTFDFESPTVRGQREGNSSTDNVPFGAASHWAFTPDEVAIGGIATEYKFTVFRPGQPLVVEKYWTPVPVIAEEGAERKRQVTHNMEQNFPGWTWNGPPVPGTKPAYVDLLAGEGGRYWVQVSQPGVHFRSAAQREAAELESERPERRFRAPVAFDVFNSDGEYLGHVRAPAGFSMGPNPIFRGDTVWAMVEDPETGIPRLNRLQVTFGGAE